MYPASPESPPKACCPSKIWNQSKAFDMNSLIDEISGLKTAKKVKSTVKSVIKQVPTTSTLRGIAQARKGQGKRYKSHEDFKDDLRRWK